MRRLAALVLGAAFFSATVRANAEQPSAARRPAVEAFLLTGDDIHNPGEPPTGKLVTILSLYSLSAASLALGTGFGLASLSDKSRADDFRDEQPAGFCADVSSEACATYDDLRSSQSRSARASGLFFGLGALFFVGGAATAQFWPNSVEDVAVLPTVGPHGAGLVLRSPL